MSFELTEYELSGAVAYMEEAASDVLESPDHRHWSFVDHLSEDSLLWMCLDRDTYKRYHEQSERLDAAQHNIIVDAWHNTIQEHLELNDRVG